jgi:hypothetical protein
MTIFKIFTNKKKKEVDVTRVENILDYVEKNELIHYLVVDNKSEKTMKNVSTFID